MSNTALMIGVHSLTDAQLARDKGAKLIEARNPTRPDAIMPLGELRQLCKHFEDVCPVAAFCGELPMNSQQWCDAIETVSAAAVDILLLPVRFPGDFVTTLQEVSHLTDLYPTCALIDPFSLPDGLSIESVIGAIGGCHWMGICLELQSKESTLKRDELSHWIHLIHEADLMAGLSLNVTHPDLENLGADFIRLPLEAIVS